MREIKFRCFSKVAQQIVGWDIIVEKKNLHRLIVSSEHYLMQFTGLLDKHGKEIYDGDIVRYNDEKIHYICAWDSENAWRGFRPPYGRMFNHPLKDMKKISGCEVIGNIYENPELLK